MILAFLFFHFRFISHFIPLHFSPFPCVCSTLLYTFLPFFLNTFLKVFFRSPHFRLISCFLSLSHFPFNCFLIMFLIFLLYLVLFPLFSLIFILSLFFFLYNTFFIIMTISLISSNFHSVSYFLNLSSLILALCNISSFK